MSFQQTLREVDEQFYSTFPQSKPTEQYYFYEQSYAYYDPQTYYNVPYVPQEPVPEPQVPSTQPPQPQPLLSPKTEPPRPTLSARIPWADPPPIRPAAMRLSPLPSMRQLERKPPLACLFCRGRKIACGPPIPGSTDKTCNQCQKRSLPCEYPSESRRGMRKKKTADSTDSSKSPNADRSTSVAASPPTSGNFGNGTA